MYDVPLEALTIMDTPIEKLIIMDTPLEALIIMDTPLEGLTIMDTPLESVTIIDTSLQDLSHGLASLSWPVWSARTYMGSSRRLQHTALVCYVCMHNLIDVQGVIQSRGIH